MLEVAGCGSSTIGREGHTFVVQLFRTWFSQGLMGRLGCGEQCKHINEVVSGVENALSWVPVFWLQEGILEGEKM